MYLLASARIRVHCRAEETYDYATNLENFAAWFPGVLGVTAGNDLPQDAVGKIYQEIVAIPFGGASAC